MQYWKGPSESMIGEGFVWIEFQEDGSASRQVDKYGDKWLSSIVDYHEGIGPSLFDGNIDDLDLSESEKISKEEFEVVWAKAKSSY